MVYNIKVRRKEYMNYIGDYIKKYRGNMSLREFAEKCDISHTHLDSIEKGFDPRTGKPVKVTVETLKKIARAMNMSINDLLIQSGDVKIEDLVFDNAEPIDIKTVDTIKIPVLGIIKAGTPIEAQEDILDYVEIPREWTRGNKKYYGLKISGDSMYPKYLSGDTVVFEQTEDMEYANNKDACVMVNGFDATFKKFNVNQDGVTLTPLNLDNEDGYLPTFYNVEQIHNLPVKVLGIAKRRISDIN